MTETDEQLRRTVGRLTAQERRTLRITAEQSDQRLRAHVPRLAEFWSAVVALVNEVDALERARARSAAAQDDQRGPLPARRARQ